MLGKSQSVKVIDPIPNHKHLIPKGDSLHKNILAERVPTKNIPDYHERRISGQDYEDSYKLVRDTERFGSGEKGY